MNTNTKTAKVEKVAGRRVTQAEKLDAARAKACSGVNNLDAAKLFAAFKNYDGPETFGRV